ncbi:hypothetical protein H310_09625 [Aphanomyces invadans]|uniref:Aspartic peptidase DDI1-type domain-containing protein n=1 Tax=Aphanomyces invadans TaxID=157072 RepID=A0A024TV76_9STRA|nr:hypothetical protein H310_09625 [Aphanomyces invadans]ETV97262.1 hypothetical protein H310_09625 [Aphanomyces invadans]|eukprot:XP_008873970.1 hypothetical protein H310_09625 [Aphanomyces invadans]
MSDPEYINNSGDDGYLTPVEYSGKCEEERAAEKRRILRKAKVNQVLNNPTGEKRLNLNGVLDVPYCADTGATLNIIPQRMVMELKHLQPDLVVESVPADRSRAEGPDGQELELIGHIALRLTICTAAGPVRVPHAVACYITTNGTEFLVSDDTLKTR